MLQHVVDFASKNIPGLQPGFGPKRVRWRIDIGLNGEAVVLPYGGDENGGELEKCPEYPANLLQGGGKCHFLVETLQVILLLLDKSDDPAKYHSKNKYFVELLEMAATGTPDLISAVAFFKDSQQVELLKEQAAKQGAKPTDKAFFTITGMDPLKNTNCLTWWSGFRSSLSNEVQGASRMLCLLSGENVTPESTHPKISGLKAVGGRGQDVLVGFDKKAFESFGLGQSANCAMAEDAVNRYSKGLDFLIANHSRMLAGAKVVHWFKEAVQLEFDPLSFLSEPPELTEGAAQQSAREILESLRKGQRPVPANNRFYAMTISGASGRVMLRDWMEGSFEELVERIEHWFADLEIVGQFEKGLARDPKFNEVCLSMVRYDKSKSYFENLNKLPAPTAATLWRVALAGLPIPQPIIAQAMARFRADLIDDKLFNQARMGLIKAYFIRKGGDHQMSAYLNKEHPEPAYQCGRLLAVLAGLQRAALGDVGAGVVQRYYVAASQTPGLTLGRLFNNAKNHLNKLEGGLAYRYEGQIAEIMSRIQDRIPSTLNLDQQSLFALGYYQQIAANRAGKNNGDNETIKGDNQ
ncbi:MAG: type I-C CRISPR-associated protein Cas8c/Csd1 [Desulfuromonadales bacterium]|nr:type I-C CRISPR-associated protein Cas8c/Csd1 [Desulfuromonadales bacterium]